MEENVMLPLDEFLKEHGFEEETLNDKEKLKVLKGIILAARVEQDLEEMRYTKNKEQYSQKEYFNNIIGLDNVQIQAQYYILMVNKIKKETRKLKRKEKFQKVIRLLKK